MASKVIYKKLHFLLNYNLIRFRKVFELLKDRKLLSYFREAVYFNRKVFIVEKNLIDATDKQDILLRKNIKFIEINPETCAINNYEFANESRQMKASFYLDQGWRGHAIVKDNKIIGDNWYYPHSNSQQITNHPDALTVGIKMAEGHVYSFDTYIVPAERGNNIAASFLNTVMYSLHQKGYTTAWGCVYCDNTASVWNTTVVNKWRVVKTLKVSRFIHPKRFVRKS